MGQPWRLQAGHYSQNLPDPDCGCGCASGYARGVNTWSEIGRFWWRGGSSGAISAGKPDEILTGDARKAKLLYENPLGNPVGYLVREKNVWGRRRLILYIHSFHNYLLQHLVLIVL